MTVLIAMSTAALAQTAEERLFEAIEEGRALVAEGMVARGGGKLDARNKEGETPLHVAIEKGMRELAEMLVKAGARVNARSGNSETPLHAAALHSETYFAALLLEAGADAKLRNDDGESPLHWAVLTGNGETARLLVERGAVNPTSTPRTAAPSSTC